MIKVFALPSHQQKDRTSGVDFARVIQPMTYLNKLKGFKVDIYDIHAKKQPHWIQVAKEYDLVFLNYTVLDWAFAAMGAPLRGEGKKMMMDIDDAVWYVRPDNPTYEQFHANNKKFIYDLSCMLDEVDFVTTTSRYLKNVVCDKTFKRHEDVKVIPNYIDLNRYTYRKKHKNKMDITILHMGCFDDKTEVLTENGFKLFKDLDKKEKVATLNKDGELEYQKPIVYQEYKFNGNLLCAKGQQIDYAVTPEHQLYVSCSKKHPCKLRKASDVYNKHFAFLGNNGGNNCLRTLVKPVHQFKKKYIGYVYDLTVPNHTLYVRRNGKCMWSGNSTTHFEDLLQKPFMEGITKIMEEFPNVTFLTVGSFIPEYRYKFGQRYQNAFGDRDIYKWIEDKYPEFMKKADIVVAPLEWDIYNRSKSFIKYLEYSASKLPGVYQDVNQYQEIVRNNINGFLASRKEDWYNYLKNLVLDTKLRKKIGEKAYLTVKEYQIQDHINEYANLVREVLDKPEK